MKLLLGGSPCTHWSIAQTRNRETQPEGLGWELFRNYLIARERYGPDFYLYENNKSMAPAIRAQITAELGVEPILINSALVSAQSRQRLYWTNIPGVELPEDRGLILLDVLDSGAAWNEKGYCLSATEYKGCTLEHNLTHHVRACLKSDEILDFKQAPGEITSAGAKMFGAACSGKHGNDAQQQRRRADPVAGNAVYRASRAVGDYRQGRSVRVPAQVPRHRFQIVSPVVQKDLDVGQLGQRIYQSGLPHALPAAQEEYHPGRQLLHRLPAVQQFVQDVFRRFAALLQPESQGRPAVRPEQVGQLLPPQE